MGFMNSTDQGGLTALERISRRWKKYLEKMEEISGEDGGNISRRWRKYLEKVEQRSQEDRGNVSRRWRKYLKKMEERAG